VLDVVKELETFGCKVDIYDPWANASDVKHEYQREIIPTFQMNDYSAIVLAVAHNQFKTLNFSTRSAKTVLYDIKSILPLSIVDGRL
jgi:UDP-N-acetyl-D-galactosamine dehydrogenase